MKKFLLLFLLCGCSYGIKEQRELRDHSKRAKEICKKDKSKCEEAKICMRSAYEGIYTIQQTQENKLNKRSTANDESNSIISYKKAKDKCQQF